MTLSELINALEAVCESTYHRGAPSGVTDYIVWHEYGMRPVNGDDAAQIRITRVQIDAVTQDDGATEGMFTDVMDALDALGVPYSVEDISFDDSLMAMRCIIQCEVA